MHRLLFFAFSILTVSAYCQKVDTTRKYMYGESRRGWVLTVKNNKTFIFENRKVLETISGKLVKKGDDYFYFVDTSTYDKYQRLAYTNFIETVKLSFHHSFNTSLVVPAPDSGRRLRGQDIKISPSLHGYNSTGSGLGGFGINVPNNDTIAFYQWADVGGKEPNLVNR